MNSEQAKQILELHRPGLDAGDDPEVAAALELARRDPILREWYEQSRAVHAALRDKFMQIPVPAELRAAILAQRKIVEPAWWHPSAWLAAAALFALLLGVALVWVKPAQSERFAGFRSRMVRTALRQYRMDIMTNDLSQVRQFLARRGAPSDYVLPNELQKLSLTGGGCLHWRDNPVSMVCFDRGDKQMLFLFVINRAALHDAPSASPQVIKVSKLQTESWSEGDKTYVLARPEDSAVLRKPQPTK